MYRTSVKISVLLAISLLQIDLSIYNKISPPWLPHVNAMKFCLLFAWASNLSTYTKIGVIDNSFNGGE